MKKLTILSVFTITLLCLNAAVFGQVSITGTTPVTQNFDTIGATATAALPSGWRVDSVSASPTTVYANAATATTAAAGTSGTGALTGTSGGGTYNFANGVTATSTDRAVGWLTSGSYSSPRQMFVQLTNNSGQTLTSLAVSFDVEKYRTGTRAFNINFFSSTDGTNWTAQTGGDLSYSADAANAVVNPPVGTSKSVTISNLNIANGASIYLRWSYTGVGGNTNAQGLGIDNFSATAAFATPSNIDLTISRDTFDTTIEADGTVTYDVTIANGGMDAANNVKANFVIPNGLTYTSTNTNCGFTSTLSGSTLSLTGGTVSGGGSCALQIIGTATGGGYIIDSLPTEVTVDPDGTITETDETNNNASGNAVTTVLFPTTIVGLYGRTSLSQLMNDLLEIGGAQRVILDQNLTETSNVTVPDGVTLDFENFTVSGDIIFTFGSEGGAGFRTVNVNGLGDAAHPGSLQVTQVNFVGATDVEYYQFSQTLGKLGEIRPTAYNHPQLVFDFRINNPAGLNILAPFQVIGDFYLTDGIIYNGTNNITLSIFTRNNGENGSGGSETSYVAGPVTKLFPFFLRQGDSGLATNYIFPVGTVDGAQNGYSPIQISNFTIGAPNSGLTVQAFDTNAPGIPTPSLSRYWQIDEIGNITTDIQFNWRVGDDSAITNQAVATIVRNGVVACDMNCSLNFTNRNASITGVSNFSPWTIAQTSPTAAGASISGRVLNSRGFAVARAKVLVTDQAGNTVTTTTNDFGNYNVEGLRAGETYVVNVIAKQAQYNSRVITLNEDATNLDFTPQE
ncbi:MAG: carboxypeptidase regulatory-like domain-containing protein [Pyrinomonadaceae bacterium]|nr:carboxypeptidase regulatory-like domain-containing protein [Pyrinomonadaceae bacterium]